MTASGNTTLSKIDSALAKQRHMKSSVIHGFFRPAISRKCAATTSTASTVATVHVIIPVNDRIYPASVENEPAGDPPTSIKTCKGVLMRYRTETA